MHTKKKAAATATVEIDADLRKSLTALAKPGEHIEQTISRLLREREERKAVVS
jgi:hypothetical protein